MKVLYLLCISLCLHIKTCGVSIIYIKFWLLNLFRDHEISYCYILYILRNESFFFECSWNHEYFGSLAK